jgi:hypothetical protein
VFLGECLDFSENFSAHILKFEKKRTSVRNVFSSKFVVFIIENDGSYLCDIYKENIYSFIIFS